MEIFDLQNLTFSYPGSARPSVKDVSLTIGPGEFVLLAGPSGCGKSTLLRQLKTVLAPHGDRTGSILFHGQPLDEVDNRTQSARIGFVQQNPESQIVTDKVWHELAFGLESLGLDTGTIRGRVAEMASYFGIEDWFYRNVTELSGGQKQLLNLASVMVMQPDVLILDEPTSQLDPIAAMDFLATLGRINRELGTTVLLTEHRMEDAFPLASRVIFLEEGRVFYDGSPARGFDLLRDLHHPMLGAMPIPMQIWSALESSQSCPMSVAAGRSFLTEYAAAYPLGDLPVHTCSQRSGKTPVITAKEVWFRYEKEGRDIVKGLNLEIYPGEIFCLMGGNGTGKTTSLSLLSGQRKPYRGSVDNGGRRCIAMPQNPQALFTKHTLEEELLEMLPKKPEQTDLSRMEDILRLCRLEHLVYRHPYDLSGGEQQRAALAKVLLAQPEVLLLDEPTKGLDAEFKAVFAQIIHSLSNSGVTIVMVSHDVEFCAVHADRCALFFDGSIVSEDTPVPFFSGKSFYTTSANRMARHLLPMAVTAEDVIVACGGKPAPAPSPERPRGPGQAGPAPKTQERKLPPWRKWLAGISGATALATAVYSFFALDIKQLFLPGVEHPYRKSLILYGIMLAALGICVTSLNYGQNQQRQRLLSGGLSRKYRIVVGLMVVSIPATLFLCLRFLGPKKYLVTSFLVLFETMAPFFLAFEGRKPQARELVLLAVLCALSIAGRAVFFALPTFKPVMALTILSGVAFGGEAGFLVGAVSMFGSNMLFGQGPWTPWQMFTMGLIGFLAGVLANWGFLRRSKIPLAVFGATAALLIYGGIMNPASVIMYQADFNWQMIITAYFTGIPTDISHGFATAFFLLVLTEPMLKKLDRIKLKFGLMGGTQ